MTNYWDLLRPDLASKNDQTLTPHKLSSPRDQIHMLYGVRVVKLIQGWMIAEEGFGIIKIRNL